MALLADANAPFDAVGRLGLAIHKTPIGYHCGVLYLQNGSPRILDLAFHHLLRDEVAAQPFRCGHIGLDDVTKVVVSNMIAKIAYLHPLIPYGFNSQGDGFDLETGDIYPYPPGHGLTCATFVMAVFASCGIRIVDETTWEERPDDRQWRDQIVGLLHQRGEVEHAAAVTQAAHDVRVRPDEVVGAATENEWPVDFQTTEELAAQIRADLEA